MSSELPKHNRLELLAKFFKGFSDSSRIAILSSLRTGPKSVGQLVEELALPQSNVSNHLACLKDCGHVIATQEGRFVYYKLSDERLEMLLKLADALLTENAKSIFECVHGGDQHG